MVNLSIYTITLYCVRASNVRYNCLRDLKMVVAKIRYEEGSYEGEVNEGKGKDDIPVHKF